MNKPIMKNETAFGTLFLPLLTIKFTNNTIITPIKRNNNTGPQDNEIHSGFMKANAEKNTNIPINDNITPINVFSFFDIK